MKERCYSSLDTHSQNRTFRASLQNAHETGYRAHSQNALRAYSLLRSCFAH